MLVDIAIDQGGCFEGSRPTTHADPTFKVHDTVFYCVANMPGAVPHTSTYALTNVTLPYAVQLANLGWREALKGNPRAAPGSEHPRGTDHLRGRRCRRSACPTVDVDDSLTSASTDQTRDEGPRLRRGPSAVGQGARWLAVGLMAEPAAAGRRRRRRRSSAVRHYLDHLAIERGLGAQLAGVLPARP